MVIVQTDIWIKSPDVFYCCGLFLLKMMLNILFYYFYYK